MDFPLWDMGSALSLYPFGTIRPHRKAKYPRHTLDRFVRWEIRQDSDAWRTCADSDFPRGV